MPGATRSDLGTKGTTGGPTGGWMSWGTVECLGAGGYVGDVWGVMEVSGDTCGDIRLYHWVSKPGGWQRTVGGGAVPKLAARGGALCLHAFRLAGSRGP